MTRALPVGWDQGPSARATYTAFHGRRLACHPPLLSTISPVSVTRERPRSQCLRLLGTGSFSARMTLSTRQNVRIVGQVLIWPAYKAADPPYGRSEEGQLSEEELKSTVRRQKQPSQAVHRHAKEIRASGRCPGKLRQGRIGLAVLGFERRAGVDRRAPADEVEILHEQHVEDRHDHLGHERREEEAGDLDVAHRLPERAPFESQRNQAAHRGKYRNQHGRRRTRAESITARCSGSPRSAASSM